MWSGAGRSITYRFEEGSAHAIYEAPVHAPGPPQLLLEGRRMTPVDYSPDGRQLAFMTFEHGAPRIAFLDRETKQVSVQNRGAEFQFHPDGQWVTFIVLGDMYLARGDGAGPRIPVFSGGGAQGRWSRDGRRLYYLAADRKLMEVPVEIRDGQASVGTPRPLFQTRVVAPSYAFFQYDIRPTTPPEFIVNSLRAEAPLTFVSDWTALLPR